MQVFMQPHGKSEGNLKKLHKSFQKNKGILQLSGCVENSESPYHVWAF